MCWARLGSTLRVWPLLLLLLHHASARRPLLPRVELSALLRLQAVGNPLQHPRPGSGSAEPPVPLIGISAKTIFINISAASLAPRESRAARLPPRTAMVPQRPPVCPSAKRCTCRHAAWRRCPHADDSLANPRVLRRASQTCGQIDKYDVATKSNGLRLGPAAEQSLRLQTPTAPPSSCTKDRVTARGVG